MKRRDFLTRSAVGLAASVVIPGAAMANAKSAPENNAENIKQAIPESNVHGFDEVMNYTDKPRSGVVLGGIGAGGAEIRKDGIWYNWSILNNQPRGTGSFLMGNVTPSREGRRGGALYLFEPGETLSFKVRYQVGDEEPRMKLFQIDDSYVTNNISMHVYEFPWMSGVEKISYKARFPFAWLQFSDPEMPFVVDMETWSPFIPNDLKNSSLPLLFFKFKVTSKINKPVDVAIETSMRNLVGIDADDKLYTCNLQNIGPYIGYEASADRLDANASTLGSIGMVSFNADDTTYHFGWAHRHTYHEKFLRSTKLANVNETDSRNYHKNKKGDKKAESKCFNALAVYNNLQPNGSFNAEFALAWHFPNNFDQNKKVNLGNYYDNFFKSSTEVLKYAADNKDTLYLKTKAFFDNYYASTVPPFVLDQINSQLTTFVTSGVLSKNKDFGIIEGITPHQSWGPVGTTDVNMYGGVMVTALFPELQMSTMRIHKKLQNEGGEIRHSFQKGMSEFIPAVAGVSDRLDLPSQYVVMVMRDFFWTNDKEYLTEFWPSIKKAIDFVLKNRDLNGDEQPDMTGIMSSYDNFAMFGMASYIQGQWLCALASAIEGAKVMGDSVAQQTYTRVYEKGKKLANEKLWNGNYFRLYSSDLGTIKTKDGAHNEITKDVTGTDEGCLTDQIVGQWAAHWSGLGYIFEKEHTHIALDNILKMSYKPNFGLRNCSWPGDKYWHELGDDVWVDQANTCWSGVELSFASFLLYEGKYFEALRVIKTVDDRYRRAGRYFDHQEFGGHYFRAMGAWGIINGLAGLSINQGAYKFAPQLQGSEFKLFVAFPGATIHIARSGNKFSAKVLSGTWNINNLDLMLLADNATKKTAIVNEKLYHAVIDINGTFKFNFEEGQQLTEGNEIEIS